MRAPHIHRILWAIVEIAEKITNNSSGLSGSPKYHRRPDNNFRLLFNPSSTYFYVFYYRNYKSFLFGFPFFIIGFIDVAINLSFYLLKSAICNLFPFKLAS